MRINPTATLALISDLYAQIDALQARNDELEQADQARRQAAADAVDVEHFEP